MVGSILFVSSYSMAKQTTYQKWLKKKLKKNGDIRIDSSGPHAWAVPDGVVTITRIKYSESTNWEGHVTPKVEVDIEYRGIIKLHGNDVMGPDRCIVPGRHRSWRSTISRNKRVRSSVRDGISNYLKYFGIIFRWNSDLEIKKVVWVDSNI